MSLKGSFSQYMSPMHPGRHFYSFTLYNDNLLSSEKISFALGNKTGSVQPRTFMDVTIKARESLAINIDTLGWEWCQYDFFAIIDNNGRVKQSWTFQLNEYLPGQCPTCHGSRRCPQCQSPGLRRGAMLGQVCPFCGGTGLCMTCYIPVRQPGVSQPGTSTFDRAAQEQQQSDKDHMRRLVKMYRERIDDHIREVEDLAWRIRGYEINGQTLSLRSLYSADRQRKIDLEYEIRDLRMKIDEIERQL